MSSNTLAIEKLGSHNYAQWCEVVKHVLKEWNGWNIVSCKETAPELNANQPDSGLRIELRNFYDCAKSAKTTHYLNVNLNYWKMLEDCETASDAWEVLEKAFCPIRTISSCTTSLWHVGHFQMNILACSRHALKDCCRNYQN